MISEATWQTARHAAEWRPPEGMIYSVTIFPAGDMLTANMTFGDRTASVVLFGGMLPEDVDERITEKAICLLREIVRRPDLPAIPQGRAG